MTRKFALWCATVASCCLAPEVARAGTATANLTVQMTITASCTINVATLVTS